MHDRKAIKETDSKQQHSRFNMESLTELLMAFHRGFKLSVLYKYFSASKIDLKSKILFFSHLKMDQKKSEVVYRWFWTPVSVLIVKHNLQNV